MEQTIFTSSDVKKGTGPFKKKNGKAEEKIQLRVCDYLRKNYPDVIWACDLASGMKLPIHIAAKNSKMRSSRGQPDLFIAHQRRYNEWICLHGLFLELKSEGVTIYKKDGLLRSDEHLKEQHKILLRLREQGYKAEFACGFEEAVKIIDEYLQP